MSTCLSETNTFNTKYSYNLLEKFSYSRHHWSFNHDILNKATVNRKEIEKVSSSSINLSYFLFKNS